MHMRRKDFLLQDLSKTDFTKHNDIQKVCVTLIKRSPYELPKHYNSLISHKQHQRALTDGVTPSVCFTRSSGIVIDHMFLATSDKTRRLTHTFRWVYKYFSTLTGVRDYYNILNVKSTASPEEIKAAYLDLSKKYHPDKCLDDKAKIHFAEVSEAYSVLGRSESRQEYDLNRKVNAFGISADAFRMHYPHPPPDLDKVGFEAYGDEMRRRWVEKMTQWAKAQGQYELERGRAMKPSTGVYQFVPPITGYTHINGLLFISTFLAGAVLLIKSLS
ncbi:unnamed protein product [Schistosoma intercalatum]|nr:unnamed protein product [Schistosoma intercalatum]